MFGQLNKEYVYAQGRGELFNRGSFYFREKQWTEQEMADISFENQGNRSTAFRVI